MAQNQRRMVYSKIWSSTQFASLSDRAKILFIGMLTLADDDGRLIANASYLRGQIFSFDEKMEISDIKKARQEIKDKNLIEVYEVDGVEYVQHPNWKKYQIIRGDLYSPSTLPDSNGIVTKPLRSRYEAVTKSFPKISKDKISKDKISKDNRVETPSQIFKNFLSFSNQERKLFLEEKLSRSLEIEEEKEIECFVDYWTEPNKSGTKQRWELQKTFDLIRRIRNWFNNMNKFNKQNYGNQPKQQSNKYAKFTRQVS